MPLEPSRIATARLVLHPVSRELAEEIVDGEISSVIAGDGWPHEDTADGLRRTLEYGGPYGWLVMLDGVAIGDCGTHGDPNDAGEIELGYGLAKPYRGQGYGSEVALALSRWLLDPGGATRVVGRVEHENVASRRVLERAGFALEGSDEKHLRYVLVAG